MGHFLLSAAVAAVSVMLMYANSISINSGNDGTMRSNVTGENVVEQTLEIIQTSCVFDNDKLFMRRLAYVETEDGLEDGSFRDDYHGGIWKVDEYMFDTLKTPRNQATLDKYTKQFMQKFDIDWEHTSWLDCRKAHVSALAARLYLQLLNPWRPTSNIQKQAAFWASKYHKGGVLPKDFEDAANRLDEGCDRGVDLAFVLDASSSIGSSNFDEMKNFVKDVVEAFDISSDKTRVSIISYGTYVYTNFYFNAHLDKSSVIDHINRIVYYRGSTNTHLGLATLHNQIFTPRRGARGSTVPKFTIFLTGGRSNYPSMTIKEAKNVHDHDIIVFAIGIGSAELNELKAIGSNPECLYLLMLKGFNDIGSLKDSILKSTCEAPVIIRPGTAGTNGAAKIKKGNDQNCQMKVGKEGIRVKIKATKGGITFYTSSNTYPSESYYDDRVEAVPGMPGVMFVKRPSTIKNNGTVFCNIKGDETMDTEFEYSSEVDDTDYCKSHECKNGATCMDDMHSGYTCACAAEYEGRLCGERIKYDCINKSPCTEANEEALRFFFPHYNETMFVQCDHLTCYVHHCPPGTIFDPAFDVVSCIHV